MLCNEEIYGLGIAGWSEKRAEGEDEKLPQIQSTTSTLINENIVKVG